GAPLAKPPRKPEPPTMQQILTTDTTIEALSGLLHENPRGIIVKHDELTGLVHSMNQYKGGHGADKQHWLSFWGGASITVNRKKQDPLFIAKPVVNIIGCLPPDMLNELTDERGRQDGFIHRILFAFPDRVPKSYPRIGIAETARRDYAHMIEALHALRPNIATDGREAPKVL